MFRSCDATDPRDKIFAFRDIASKADPAAFADIDVLKPDYCSSVQQVYLETATFLLQSSGELALLSHVQDPSRTRISGLPSWVPDFSVELGRDCLETENYSWCFASGKDIVPMINIVGTSKLELEGVLIDKLSDVASLTGCYFTNTAQIALKSPSWYLSNDSEKPDIIGYFPPFAVETKRSPLYFPIFQESQSGMITRVEALWRTLIEDCIHNQHPAPTSAGFGFSDWISTHLKRAVDLVTTIQRQSSNIRGVQHGDSGPAEARMDEKLDLWGELHVGENGGFYTWEELQLAREAFLDPKESDHQARMTITKGRGIDLDRGGLRFLPGGERLKFFFNHKPATESKVHFTEENPLNPMERARLSVFEARMREVKRGRRMFRTDGNLLGMGSRSVEVGDEVWVLKGGNVPFVLRRVKEGVYRLVGDAYVHGIMHGEAIPTRCDFRKILLQ
jgi:hypothetical protein